MIEKKVIVEEVNEKDILENTLRIIQDEHFSLFGIDISNIELERIGDSHGILQTEEVTMWLKIDEDVIDTEYTVNNEITIQIPMDRVIGLDEVSELLIEEMYKVKEKLIEHNICIRKRIDWKV